MTQEMLDAQAEADELLGHVPEFQRAAAELKQQYGAAEHLYGGVQRIMEPAMPQDATPALASTAAQAPTATMPAQAPDPAMLVTSVATSAGNVGAKPAPAGKDAVAVADSAAAAQAAANGTGQGDDEAPAPEPEFVYVPPRVPRMPEDIYGPPPPVQLGGYRPVPAPNSAPSTPNPNPPLPVAINSPLPIAINPPLPIAINPPLPVALESSIVLIPVPDPPPPYVPPRRTGIAQQPGAAGPWSMTMGLQSGQPLGGEAQVPNQMSMVPESSSLSDWKSKYITVIVPRRAGSGVPFMLIAPNGAGPGGAVPYNPLGPPPSNAPLLPVLPRK